MASGRICLWLIFMIITHSVGEDTRSFLMSLMTGSKFECVNTPCLPFANIITPTIMKCQMACLAQAYCRAASFHQSTSNCELFTDMSNEIANMVTDIDIISMIVITGTRFPPESTTTTATTTSTTSITTTTATTTSTTTITITTATITTTTTVTTTTTTTITTTTSTTTTTTTITVTTTTTTTPTIAATTASTTAAATTTAAAATTASTTAAATTTAAAATTASTTAAATTTAAAASTTAAATTVPLCSTVCCAAVTTCLLCTDPNYGTVYCSYGSAYNVYYIYSPGGYIPSNAAAAAADCNTDNAANNDGGDAYDDGGCS
ncbi:unnamed protein product [Adineta steineri]|uniref:Apple domain-containing protein n=2 Tax=Adineta steineri TaxID=433720 RepID=A0A819DTF4_9BILA|nr:unnamed protein product [Adineta steineri]CAF1494474.1 unnamed protein product [Adineta steineri]CAF3833744.1 unnamed protein product [Adineta steineri]CAF3894552.1 unnamed protein product [Adineta steineri]